MLTRRRFLRALGIGTAAAIVAPELLVPEGPRRRIWQVGAQLQRVQPIWLGADHGYTYDPPRALTLNDMFRLSMQAAGRGVIDGGTLVVSPQTYRSLCAEVETLRGFAAVDLDDPIHRDIELNTVAGSVRVVSSAWQMPTRATLWSAGPVTSILGGKS